MTSHDRKILNRINNYAAEVLADTNPQKVPVSCQLECLKPIMAEIAKEEGTQIEDIFILYMDLNSQAVVAQEQKFQDFIKEDAP